MAAPAADTRAGGSSSGRRASRRAAAGEPRGVPRRPSEPREWLGPDGADPGRDRRGGGRSCLVIAGGLTFASALFVIGAICMH